MLGRYILSSPHLFDVPPDIHIFAPDLLASERWYADVLALEPVAYGLVTVRFDLAEGLALYLTAQGQEAEFTLLVPHAQAYAQRLRNRAGLPGENQGRVLETRPDGVSLVDPAGNLLRLIEQSA
jgi:catechol 2,3-dioxygenase-like lactoylglutathione lyase family enzyme